MLKKRFGPYVLNYRSEHDIQSLLRELSTGAYDFKTKKDAPVIIDAGAHIGMTMLWFKWNHPAAEIICFEPNPETFKILKLNVEENHLEDVVLVNAALSDHTGETTLYGMMSHPNADTRGNSIVASWGQHEKLTTERQVSCVCLSDYLTVPVDFLKLNIEGAEYIVLYESRNKLHLVEQLVVEVHYTNQSAVTEFDIKNLLRNYHFQIDKERPRDITTSLPEQWQQWIDLFHPKLTVLKARQKITSTAKEFSTATEQL